VTRHRGSRAGRRAVQCALVSVPRPPVLLAVHGTCGTETFIFRVDAERAHLPEARALIVAAFVTVFLMLAHVLHERMEAPCRARFYGWSMRFRGDVPHEAAVN